MDVLIKCSGECAIVQGRFVGAYAFTVRLSHRTVYRESGMLTGGAATVANLEAVRRAAAWLEATPSGGGLAAIRFGAGAGLPEGLEAPAAAAQLKRLREQGWMVELVPVSPEYISEAAALVRLSVLEAALRANGRVPPRSCSRPSAWVGGRAARRRLRSAAPRCQGSRFRGKRQAPGPEATRDVAAAKANPPASPPDEKRRPRRSWPDGIEADALIVCDGGYKPESSIPGIATYAFLVWDAGRLVRRECGVVCCGRVAGNLMAEIGAVMAALRWLSSVPLAAGCRFEIRCDCRWVIETLAGSRPTIPHGSRTILREGRRLLSSLRRRGFQVALRWVPRKMVSEADALCRQVYTRELAQKSGTELLQPVRAFLQGGQVSASA
jgi:ribonuclease HI